MAGFVLANGSVSSKSGGEGEIRRRLVEENLVDCIVAMPSNLFFNTTIPVSLWFVSKNRSNGKFRDRRDEVLFIDARKLGRMETRTIRVLDDTDLAKVADAYHAWRSKESATEYEDIQGFCRSADIESIAAHDFVLSPGRYVGTEDAEEDGEPVAEKISRLRGQLFAEFEEGHKLEKAIRELLDRRSNRG
jgi:type I restriction enzyme M protein